MFAGEFEELEDKKSENGCEDMLENNRKNKECSLSDRKSTQYELLARIGNGAYGEVRAGRCKRGGYVAIKIIKASMGNQMGKNAFRELQALQNLSSFSNHNDYVVSLLDSYPEQLNICLVLEYMPSDLGKILSNRNCHFSRREIKGISLMLLQSLNFIHSKGIIHRDIKPSNILISNLGRLKLGDFGLARTLPDYSAQNAQNVHKVVNLSPQVATRWYRAPELLFASTNYDQSVDLWGAGAVLAEALLLKPLFPGLNDIDQIFRVFQITGSPSPENSVWSEVSDLPDFNKVCFPVMPAVDLKVIFPHSHPHDINFLQQLLQLNPSKRLSACEGLKLDYFNEVPFPVTSFTCWLSKIGEKSSLEKNQEPTFKKKSDLDNEELEKIANAYFAD